MTARPLEMELLHRENVRLTEENERLRDGIRRLTAVFDSAPLSYTWWMPGFQAMTVYEFVLGLTDGPEEPLKGKSDEHCFRAI